MTRAARNLQRAQSKWSDASLAVVTWINYDTPPLPTHANGWDPSVLHGDDARAGARRLADDLTGFNATRGPTKGTLNVIGHSYGATTSSLALHNKHLGVRSYVSVAAPGVEPQIRSAADIAAEHVYAAKSPLDVVAQAGSVGSMIRPDPSHPLFGATGLPTTGVPGDESQHGVNVHDPLLYDENEHPNTYGYFDKKTQSLLNIARATTDSFPDGP